MEDVARGEKSGCFFIVWRILCEGIVTEYGDELQYYPTENYVTLNKSGITNNC